MPLDESRMHGFVATLLAESGGLVQPIEPDGLEVLAPPALQQMLGVGEFSRVGFGPTLPEGAQRVGIESDWLGRFNRVLGERGRWNRRVLAPPPRKTPDVEALLARELALDNATYRLMEAAPAWTRYLLLDFRFTAVADEKREGIQRLAINLATGAMPEMTSALLEAGPGEDGAALPSDMALPSAWDRDRTLERVRLALPWRVETALAPFLSGLRRRLTRDLDRLHAYHNDLHREAAQRAGQAGAGEAARAREEQRAAAIAREYRAKLDDLAHKYALRVNVAWIRAEELVMPVHRITVQIRRRRAERVMALDWNTLTRRLEPPPCEASWSTERPRLVCDEALHLVAPAGLAPCGGCARGYCRACHPQHCPKCRLHTKLAAFATVA